MKRNAMILGKTKQEARTTTEKPRKKYRIIVQQRKTQGDEKEAERSFMIYDFSGKTTADSIKRKLLRK